MREKIDAVKAIRDEKRTHLTELNKIKDKINAHTNEREALKKLLHRDHQDPSKIQKAIEDLEKRFETTTLKNANEEKKLMTELKTLKASIPSAEKLIQLKPEIDALYTKRKEISEILNDL